MDGASAALVGLVDAIAASIPEAVCGKVERIAVPDVHRTEMTENRPSAWNNGAGVNILILF